MSTSASETKISLSIFSLSDFPVEFSEFLSKMEVSGSKFGSGEKEQVGSSKIEPETELRWSTTSDGDFGVATVADSDGLHFDRFAP